MNQSKLLNTIKILAKNELQGVKELLDTNLLLKGAYKKECIDLFNYIMRYVDNFEHQDLAKAVALKRVFPDSPQSKVNRLEKTMTALLHVVEYYIIHFLKQDKYKEIQDNHTLAAFYRERKQFSRSDNTFQRAKISLQEKENVIDTDYYYWKCLMAEAVVDYEDIKAKGLSKENILALFDSLNEHSILKTLEWLSKVVLKRQYFEDYDLAVFHRLDAIIDKQEIYKKNPLLRLYQLELWMFITILEERFVPYYEEYTQLFIESQLNLDPYLVYSFATRERTRLVHRYTTQPNEQNLRFLFDTYNRHLATGVLLLNGRIHSNAAVNLINYAIKLKEITWVKLFLEEWEDKIGTYDDNNSEVLALCWAMYYFANKQYKKVEENIAINFENIFYGLNAKRFRIKIHFERSEFDQMYQEVEAFKVYLFRTIKPKKGLSQAHFTWNNNFITLLKQLYTLKFNPNSIKKKQLRERITNKVCSDKEWLMEKIEELKG